jgi:bifunctional DNase/RNase
VAPPTVELRVVDVRPAVPAGAGVEAGLVVLQETDPPGRMLRMFIGQPEARAIQVSWQGTVPPRPSTWDLFVSIIELLGARLHEVVITAVEEERHFFAAMELTQGGGPRTVACRPSDALALALRSPGARIVTTEDVMEAAGVLADGSKPGRVERPTPEPEPASLPPWPETPAGAQVPAAAAQTAEATPAETPAKKAAAKKAPAKKTAAKKAPVAKKAVAKKAPVAKNAGATVSDAGPAQVSVPEPITAPPSGPPPRRAAAVRKALPPRPPGQSAT